ncbi:MAG TPA: shikimate dehydrogenase [Thermomicrobiales bacterium]|nr:shikimate dehydrogenase [Thermomicrobiales bacterium]
MPAPVPLRPAHDERNALHVWLLGHPLGHSISPPMQNAGFRALGIAATYSLNDVLPEDLAGAVAALRQPDFYGANVTMPHKEAARALVDEVSRLAERVGSVNTIVNRDGVLYGDNTDVEGFLWPLRTGGAALDRWRVTVLGAGGAARAVAIALLEAGVPGITLVNRTPARAVALAASLNDPRVDTLPLSDRWVGGALAHADLLVNATGVGWHSDVPPLAPELLDRLPAHALVYDLTYRHTALLRQAEARGLATLDGLPMLVEQGALALELWTGREAPRPVMFAAARAARAQNE